ncbi:MAG: bacteriohemerythrin [Porticoccaceae bacterium]|nr:bacteriohemerythrin [Porticoccaceae bacterium]
MAAASKDIRQDLADARETRDRLTVVAAATEEITVNISSIARNTSASQSSLDTIANTTNELTSAAEEIASNTEKARSITAQAVADTERATGEFQHLETAAAEISKVTNTISEVSDQTKLLALNATIEAARAGDAGRGFAVVASEVKELASQTNLANADIKQKIEIIQAAIGTTLNSMKSVSKIILEVNEIVTTIAAAAEEQSLATNSISSTLSTATKGLGDVNTNVNEGSLAISEMNENLSTSVTMTTGVIEFMETMAVDNETMLADATKNFADIVTLQSRGDDISLLYENYQLDRALTNVDISESGLFRFDPQWSVLVDDMDAEHCKIFAHCNDIHNKVANGAKQEQTLVILKDLATFTTHHFAEEEKLMQRHAYPKLASQQSAHAALLNKVASIINSIEVGEHVNMIEVIVFLTDWLKGHILAEDLQYGEYFQERGISV